MYRKFIIFILFGVLLCACASAAPQSGISTIEGLTVTDGSSKKTYTVQDFEALGTKEASFQEVNFVGVPLAALLRDAGFDPQNLSAVKVTASDGFSANYDPQLVNREDMLVSFARVDGPLAADEGPFRIVLPDAEGKMNPRQVVEIQVIK